MIPVQLWKGGPMYLFPLEHIPSLRLKGDIVACGKTEEGMHYVYFKKRREFYE